MTSTCPNCHIRWTANFHDILVAGYRTRVWTCPVCGHTARQTLRQPMKNRLNLQDWILVRHCQETIVAKDDIQMFRNLRCDVDDFGYVHTIPIWQDVNARIKLCEKVIPICEQALDLADMFDMTDGLGAIFNINCGLHSGIKPCCVMHSMAVTTGVGMMYDLMNTTVNNQWETPYGAFIIGFMSQQQGNVAHALCPHCIIKGVVAPPLLKCDCWQGHNIAKYPKPVYELID